MLFSSIVRYIIGISRLFHFQTASFSYVMDSDAIENRFRSAIVAHSQNHPPVVFKILFRFLKREPFSSSSDPFQANISFRRIIMKKVLCAMLAAVMVTMSLTSCGDNGGSSSDASPSDSQSSASAP